METDIKHFQDVTQVRGVTEYINQLDENTLLVYSPTSKSQIITSNIKTHMVDSRIFGRSLEFIEALSRMNRSYDRIVSLGGGTATDVAKYISYKMNAEFICIPTMLSTNAYSTDKVALISGNRKITLQAKLADRIVLDLSMLQVSPQQNLFGLADILSIYTALEDWRLADEESIENINNDIYESASELLSKTIHFIQETDSNQISYEIPKIYQYIGESGNITNIYGTGRPESGSEHIFAKYLEYEIEIPHGVSVSIGIILMSILQNNYSSEIFECIKKIGTLKFIKDTKINRNLIRNILIHIEPRHDRFSIIDQSPIDEMKADELLDTFTLYTGISFD